MTNYREVAMNYLRKAAKAEKQKRPSAAYYRGLAAQAFRRQARLDTFRRMQS